MNLFRQNLVWWVAVNGHPVAGPDLYEHAEERLEAWRAQPQKRLFSFAGSRPTLVTADPRPWRRLLSIVLHSDPTYSPPSCVGLVRLYGPSAPAIAPMLYPDETFPEELRLVLREIAAPVIASREAPVLEGPVLERPLGSAASSSLSTVSQRELPF